MLPGLGFIKGAERVVAKEDHEYPDWLWGLLDEKDRVGEEGVMDWEGDEYCEFL